MTRVVHPRPGAALLEVLVALLLVGLAATGLLSELSGTSDSAHRHRTREQDVLRASHRLSLTVLLLRERVATPETTAPHEYSSSVRLAQDADGMRLTALGPGGQSLLEASLPWQRIIR